MVCQMPIIMETATQQLDARTAPGLTKRLVPQLTVTRRQAKTPQTGIYLEHRGEYKISLTSSNTNLIIYAQAFHQEDIYRGYRGQGVERSISPVVYLNVTVCRNRAAGLFWVGSPTANNLDPVISVGGARRVLSRLAVSHIHKGRLYC